MQQATSPNGSLAATTGNFLPAAGIQTSFVINLCASTTPVGLVHPTHSQLKRFTFFVSRRREDGRERFRLHMGYFSSQEEAEKLLDVVRDIYPAAWAGVAPGQKLRSRMPATAPVTVATPAAVATPAIATALAPTLTAARPAASGAEEAATRSLINVRAAIDSLRDQPERLVAAAPSMPVASPLETLRAAQVLRILEAAPAATAKPVAPAATAAIPTAAAPLRAVTQLRSIPALSAASGASSTRPGVTAAPSAVPRAPVAPPELAAYAVQLLWSVQPIDMSQVPQLAIFGAYTLYGAEGNRDGRRWYGLRLGFFTDAVSAKQVAQYVRSEFKSVSVVPVTQGERTRASGATARPLPANSTSKGTGHELNFINEVPTDTAMSGSRPALQLDARGAVVPPKAAREDAWLAAARMGSRAPTGKRAKLRVAQGTKPVSKRVRHDGPLTLEETLEILGASTLQLDKGRGELLNDATTHDRHKGAAKPARASRIGRLMDRLAERFSST